MGLRKIELDELKRRETRKKGVELALAELEDMVSSLKELHKKLDKIEQHYGTDFSQNPEASAKLMALRKELGLPEEIGVFERRTKPGLTDKITGRGFYEQLALQLLEIGNETRRETGGLLSTADLILRLNKKYEGLVVAISDITKSIGILEKNGLLKTRKLASGVQIIAFVEHELATDHEIILDLATKQQGEVSMENILLATHWSLERAESVMKFLEEKHIAERHKTLEGIKFYFHGF